MRWGHTFLDTNPPETATSYGCIGYRDAAVSKERATTPGAKWPARRAALGWVERPEPEAQTDVLRITRSHHA